jgi:hypothetical protein
LKVGWKVNPSLCWALIYWSTGTQHILYSIFNHARIFMGQWIWSATVKFPVLSLNKYHWSRSSLINFATCIPISALTRCGSLKNQNKVVDFRNSTGIST